MLIGVLSDTHIPTRAEKLPDKLIEQLKKVDLIIHAGDFVQIEVLEMLEKIAKVEAVFGNMDEEELKMKLPGKKVIEVEKVKIAIVHGCDIPWDVEKRVPCKCCKEKVDAIVYGHTHLAFNKKIGKILYFNPGSPTDQVFLSSNTFGLLEVHGKEIKGRIVEL